MINSILFLFFIKILCITFQIQVQDGSGDVVKNGQEPPAKKSRKSESAPAEVETKMVKNNLKFCSLDEALKVDWTSQDFAKRVKRMDPSFFVLQVCVIGLFGALFFVNYHFVTFLKTIPLFCTYN